MLVSQRSTTDTMSLSSLQGEENSVQDCLRTTQVKRDGIQALRWYKSAINYAAPATPQPLLPLLPAAAGVPSPAEDPSLPAPTPRPAPNRLLVFDAPCDLPAAAAVEPAPRAMAQYADRDGPSFLHDKMNDWRQRCASPAVAEASDRYPTPPGAPNDDGL